MKHRDKMDWSLLGAGERGLSRRTAAFILARSTRSPHDFAGTGEFASGVLAKETSTAKERRKLREETCRRAARRRQEKMTVPGEREVGALLATSAQQVSRPVSRELPP